MRAVVSTKARYLMALGLATAVSLGLLVATWMADGQLLYSYLIWNLFLAWLPFLIANWLLYTIRTSLWSSWPALALTVAWLAFLPNSFYMVSDFVHLSGVPMDQALLAAVTFTAFIFTGLWLGMSSLYLVHRELLTRASKCAVVSIVALLLFISSMAIYVGRDLRWNTWDVLLNPLGLLFDLSERLLHPSQYGQVLAVALPFFVLLSATYIVVWQAAQWLQTANFDK